MLRYFYFYRKNWCLGSLSHKSLNKMFSKGISSRLMLVILPLSLLWGYKKVQTIFVQPQAILVLGGSTKRLEREKFTADFAKKYPNLPIWISGGSPESATKKVFSKAGVNQKRLYLDYRANNTVENFTTLVDDLKKRDIKKLYLVTSDYHMRRATVIGEIVLGSRGIDFKTVSVPSQNNSEPVGKSIRDGVRSIVWVATGLGGGEKSSEK